jgi:glycine cleavage system aminomethyltransferase T
LTRRLYRYLQRIAHYRHVAAEQLILQGLGAGGNNRLAARQQHRQQIGNGLALSRAVIPRGNFSKTLGMSMALGWLRSDALTCRAPV